MDWPVTLALAGFTAAFAAFCGWRGAQPPNIAKGPRLVPWRPLMVLSFFVLVVLLVHIANLAGVTTGGAREPGG
jgi:hypothetical protein